MTVFGGSLPGDRPARAGRLGLIAVLLVVVFLYWMALYLYVPTLPLYLKTMTSDLALIGAALSMYGLWQLFVRLPLGLAVDWAGRRKPFLVFWLVLVAAGDWVLGSAPDIGTAAFGRALIGVAAGTWVPLVVVFSGLFPARDAVRATGILAVAGTLGRMTATAANGWLNGLGGYQLAFQLAGGAAILAAAIILFIPDIRTPPRRPSFHRLAGLLARRDVLAPSLLNALAHLADFAATFTFIPILARSLGGSDVAVSLLLSLDMAMGLTGSLLSTAAVRRLGPRLLSGLSFILVSVGVGGAALAQSLGWVFACQVIIGLGFGLGYPLFMGLSIQRVEGSERSTAMGLHQSIYSLGMFTGPWLSGRLAASLGIPAMFGIIAGITLVLGVAGAASLEKPVPQPAIEGEGQAGSASV